MRWKSGAMIVAMITGALAYDAGHIRLNPDLAHRLPVVFCLLQAIAALFISLKFHEIQTEDRKAGFKEVFQQTWIAARWVFTMKAAILIVIGGLIIDGVTRNFATINSEYYRLVELPLHLRLHCGRDLHGRHLHSPSFQTPHQDPFPLTNLSLTAAWSLLCLFGLAQTWNYWGVIPAIGTMAGLFHLGFLVSRYLNDLANSRQRATVLSVKGLLFNIGYGTASLIFAAAFLVFALVAKFLGMPRSTR